MSDLGHSEAPCPNPKGMTVEFAQEVIETRAWRIKGVGAHGSDMDVVSLDAYRDLVVELGHLHEAVTRWSESATNAKDRLRRALSLGEHLCEVTRDRDEPGCEAVVEAWDDLMADEFVRAIKEAQ